MAPRYPVSVNTLCRREEDRQAHIALIVVGPLGGLRTYESLSIDATRKLVADLTEELARFEKHQAEART
jgi:hypothetical protein